ncbi:hypothetical protein NQ314_008317 [Rhamnusium bicolor]|uniref:Uncharacterized protein n=1 Tax=Rhamnusium bicolor TaxID=1586634 RepID=A0AAV8YE99_9CUCU|nr:hypothetical protein NQ314_008317 [Rhamnusium bicolor]
MPEIEKETRGSKRICNLERIGVLTDYPDRNMLASAEYKRYIEDIEPSIKYLQQNFTSSK